MRLATSIWSAGAYRCRTPRRRRCPRTEPGERHGPLDNAGPASAVGAAAWSSHPAMPRITALMWSRSASASASRLTSTAQAAWPCGGSRWAPPSHRHVTLSGPQRLPGPVQPDEGARALGQRRDARSEQVGPLAARCRGASCTGPAEANTPTSRSVAGLYPAFSMAQWAISRSKRSGDHTPAPAVASGRRTQCRRTPSRRRHLASSATGTGSRPRTRLSHTPRRRTRRGPSRQRRRRRRRRPSPPLLPPDSRCQDVTGRVAGVSCRRNRRPDRAAGRSYRPAMGHPVYDPFDYRLHADP